MSIVAEHVRLFTNMIPTVCRATSVICTIVVHYVVRQCVTIAEKIVLWSP